MQNKIEEILKTNEFKNLKINVLPHDGFLGFVCNIGNDFSIPIKSLETRNEKQIKDFLRIKIAIMLNGMMNLITEDLAHFNNYILGPENKDDLKFWQEIGKNDKN